MHLGEHDERRPAVHQNQPYAAAHQHSQAEDQRYVENPLARVEAALMPAKPAGENRCGPAGEPTQLGPAQAQRLSNERRDRPDAQ
jgi:hypothetical protein